MKTTIERNVNHKEGGHLVLLSHRNKRPRDETSLLLMGFLTFFIMLLPRTALASATDPADRPPEAWTAWAKWAEKLHPVTDKQGHGPDIGSDEWSGALDKQLKIRDAAGHGPDVGSDEWRRAVEKKLMPKADPAPGQQRDLLSSHDTVARFTGLKDHQCMGLTALCPDRCGESGKLATFAIVKYLAYQKPGEYGDPKQEQFMVLIEDNMKNPKVPKAIRDAILALKPGDLVRLQWNHDYVTQDGSKFPERPIRKLSVLTKEQADKATAEAKGKP